MSATTPAGGHTPSQRTLAAIVFTDVVSFSARMHADEVGTLKLLQRDFAEMRRMCAEHEGAVLKTTGDGLLLTFTSAVQAVACALAMQRQFASEAKGQTAEAPLQHRIGIHLGDVLVQDEDVMGDGVNIASRLQAEAEPGGICISQTVYDVVKNKLKMQVVSLGARDLKNIAQAMPVYRLLLEAQALDPAVPGQPAGSRPVQTPPSPNRRRLLLIAGAAVALAAVFAAGVILSRRSQGVPSVPATAAGPVAVAPNPGPVPPPPKPVESGVGEGGYAGKYPQQNKAMQELHAAYLDKYDFEGLVRALRDKAEKPSAPPGLQQLLRSAEQLVRLKAWLDLDLRRYSREHPLVVHNLAGDAARDATLYLAPDLRLEITANDRTRACDWTNLKPAMVGAIIVSAMHEAKELPRGLNFCAETFARLYSLRAMTEALRPMNTRRERAPDVLRN